MIAMVKKSGRREGGFTLIEMLIALAVMALGAALIMPMATRSREDMALLAAARELALVLRSVRSAAMESGREHTLEIDAASRRYWADGVARPRSVTAELALGPPAAGDEQAGRRIVRMGPDGSSSGARLELRARGRSVVVVVEAMTGHVHVGAR